MAERDSGVNPSAVVRSAYFPCHALRGGGWAGFAASGAGVGAASALPCSAANFRASAKVSGFSLGAHRPASARASEGSACASRRSYHLRAIKTQKQVSYGISHSQREQAPSPVFVTVVKHMASLAKRLQISHPVLGGIMVKMRRRQYDSGGANGDVVANSSKAASASIAPCLFLFIPPSTVA